MIADEIWSAMHSVAVSAKHDKITGELRDFGKMANRGLDGWRTYGMKRLALSVLQGPTQGAVNPLLAKHDISVRRDRAGIHREQGIVEHFNRTLA